MFLVLDLPDETLTPSVYYTVQSFLLVDESKV